MNTALRIALWSAIAGVCMLPALSHVGYFPIHAEYLLMVSVSVVLGTAFTFIGRIPYVNILLLLVLAAFPAALYFGNFLLKSHGLIAGSIAGALALVILMCRHYDKALLLVGIVAFSQIIAVALAVPSYIISLEEHPVTRSDLPPVIHIMLDAHGSMAAIPPEAIAPEKLQAFQEDYVRRGFIVFSHAYTADKMTKKSLVRLFNVNSASKSKKWVRGEQGAFLTPNSDTINITTSSVFDAIGKERAIDITQIKYVNFNLALQKNPAVARKLTYNVRAVSRSVGSLSLHDRFILATSLAVEWFVKVLHSLAANHLFTQLGGNIAPAPHAIVSHFVLHQLGDRLSCCGERGTYYFAHLLLPHKPYVLDAHCNPLPINQWDNGKINGGSYTHYFDQASCAKREVFNLVDALKHNEKMADAIILVHGDHGAKHNKRSELSMRGSFLAIRIPGIRGRVIDTPVRLDTFYAHLLANDFQFFESDRLTPGPDSPY